MSWLPSINWDAQPMKAIRIFTDAYLDIFRRFVPPIGGLDFSPIKGPEGNIEFLCWLTRNESRKPTHEDISEIVNQAHES